MTRFLVMLAAVIAMISLVYFMILKPSIKMMERVNQQLEQAVQQVR